MNLRIVGVDFLYSIRSWSRSRGTVFWSLLFPVMLILLFGAIFSGIGDRPIDARRPSRVGIVDRRPSR